MTRISWNEVQARASAFAAEWEGESYEKGEAQSFWTAFLNIFDIDRRRAGGYFEYAVRLGGGRHGFVDMFLPGKMLIEQKSAGRSLTAARQQALSYLDGIPDHDLPEILVACDFATFEVLHLNSNEVVTFELSDLPSKVREFSVLLDAPRQRFEEQSPVTRDAAERMARLYTLLADSGFVGHKLQLFVVRLMFCHFADDARIFEPGTFAKFIIERTSVDGSDVGPRLWRLFEVLGTPEHLRPTTLDQDLAEFPYINGRLFDETTGMPDFDATMRRILIETTEPDWSLVSPAIFGSMFQGVMDDEHRHDIGAHYTSEENILRVIKPLFLDDLYSEFDRIKGNRKQLLGFHEKLGRLGFLDPACGCGNFLVIAYREIRRLEHRVLAAIQGDRVTLTDVGDLLKVRVEQFHGIEILEFPALIARTAMWLTDHQMNLEASARFGTHYARIPLTDGAPIHHTNALTTKWTDLADPKQIDYVFGNPPFLGSRTMDKIQKAELRSVAQGISQAGFLDYVVAWYLLANEFSRLNPAIECGLVSTNSISQGEQPGIFWPRLIAEGQHINFAHQSFQWTNDARGVAAVHCVIIGFSRKRRRFKQLFTYASPRDEPVLELVESISPYLIPGDEFVVQNRQRQISGGLEMAFGNMAADGGNLILSPAERDGILASDPEVEQWILPFIGAAEFINGSERYCLWLEGVSSRELRHHTAIYERVRKTREVRLRSARPKLADTPHLFAQITQRPNSSFLLIPRVSSERRDYVPMGFFGPGNIASDACLVIDGATLTDFSVLTSRMHMDWLRTVGGRLESRYRYSKDVVYNNFVMPSLTPRHSEALAELGARIIEIRAWHQTRERLTLADLYDAVSMPNDLRRAHREVDKYVDKVYRPNGFESASDRVKFMLTRNRRLAEGA